MGNIVDFEFTKDWGEIPKGKRIRTTNSFAEVLRRREVGKVVKAGSKAVKPPKDKVEPAVKKLATKAKPE